MEQEVIQLAATLLEIAGRNTANIINNKIRVVKAKKNNKEIITMLEEIIYELLNDKMEIQRIAQTYEQELVSQTITESDIKFITDNLFPIFEQFIPGQNDISVEQLKSILSVETLTIMQLLGFNYKKAIGEPLTKLCQKKIEGFIPVDSNIHNKYALDIIELAKDKESTKRYYQLTGQQYVEDSLDESNNE